MRRRKLNQQLKPWQIALIVLGILIFIGILVIIYRAYFLEKDIITVTKTEDGMFLVEKGIVKEKISKKELIERFGDRYKIAESSELDKFEVGQRYFYLPDIIPESDPIIQSSQIGIIFGTVSLPFIYLAGTTKQPDTSDTSETTNTSES